jgi:hypothetical protein
MENNTPATDHRVFATDSLPRYDNQACADHNRFSRAGCGLRQKKAAPAGNFKKGEAFIAAA